MQRDRLSGDAIPMFDLGWSELLIIAVVMIIVIGPKDLPSVLRGLGRSMGALRRTANDFRLQFEEAIRESELDELRHEFSDVNTIDPMRGVKNTIEEALDPTREFDAPPKKSKTTAISKSSSAKKSSTRRKSAPKSAVRKGK